MKHLFKSAWLIALLVPYLLSASPVSPQRAASVAGKVLNVRSSDLSLVKEAYPQTKSLSSDAPYYVFSTSGKGFAVVSGDDSISPVIGYSLDNSFPDRQLPGNVQAWLDMWAGVIQDVRNAGKVADSAVRSEWAAFEHSGRMDYAGSKQLETAQWNQGDPYNALCPVFEGRKTYSGCVATATCILMRYHNWPEKGTGTLPSYKYKDDDGIDRNIAGRELTAVYDWANMPLEYGSSSSPAQRDAVAQLMSDVGIALMAQYGTEGTGAFTEDVPSVLIDHFFFDRSTTHLYKTYLPLSDWIDLIKNNIDNIGPVIYHGYSEDAGGHCFVADGYNSQNQVHINWGWGGNGNGFYTIPNLDSFTEGHGIVHNILPDHGGRQAELLVIDGDGESNGMSADTRVFLPGVQFRVDIANIYNMGSFVFDGEVGLVRLARDGSIVEVIDTDPVKLQPLYGGGFYYDVVLDEIGIGEKLAMAYRSSVTPEWTVMLYNVEAGVNGFIRISDSQSLAEATTVKYNVTNSVMTISSKSGAEFSLKDSAGNEVTSGVSVQDNVLEVDCTKIVEDVYVLTITKLAETVSVSLKMGE